MLFGGWLKLREEIPHGFRCPGAFAIIVCLPVGRGCYMASVEGYVTNGVAFGAVFKVIDNVRLASWICVADIFWNGGNFATIVLCVEQCCVKSAHFLVFVADEWAGAIAHAGDSQVGDFLFAVSGVGNPW